MAWRRIDGFSRNLPKNEPFDVKEFLKSLDRVPKLVVLDLDYTCWPTHVDCMVCPPFKSDGRGGAIDKYSNKVGLFPSVYPIITELERCSIPIAACSKTTSPRNSYQLQTVLGIKDKFSYSEVYPDWKVRHFKQIQEKSGIPYKDMVFYDDEYDNIEDVSELGVTAVYIDDDNGLTWSVFKHGLITHSHVHKSS